MKTKNKNASHNILNNGILKITHNNPKKKSLVW